MTSSAASVYAPRVVKPTRSKRARRFWATMGAALRCTTGQPDQHRRNRQRDGRGFELRTI